MSLRFDKNSPVDNRKVEYEQAIVRLGLEKSQAIQELDGVKRDVLDVQKQREDVLLDITDKQKELGILITQKESIEVEISQAIKRGSESAVSLKRKLEEGDDTIEKKNEELDKLSEYLLSLDTDIDSKISKIAELTEAIWKMQEEVREIKAQLNGAKQELERTLVLTKEAAHSRKVILDDLKDATVELQEVQEIVSILKKDNEEGLDLVASFEGERQRLQDKDDFLRRKEADLLVYENRLKKRMEAAGIDIPMTFK